MRDFKTLIFKGHYFSNSDRSRLSRFASLHRGKIYTVGGTLDVKARAKCPACPTAPPHMIGLVEDYWPFKKTTFLPSFWDFFFIFLHHELGSPLDIGAPMPRISQINVRYATVCGIQYNLNRNDLSLCRDCKGVFDTTKSLRPIL